MVDESADSVDSADGSGPGSDGDGFGGKANPFEVLAVGTDADDRDVRRAYAKKIREARVSGDNELIERVQTAFESIRDEEQRAKIKTVVSEEDKIRPLFDRAHELIEKDDLRGARDKMLQVLELVPSLEAALMQIISLEMGLGNYENAQRYAARLVSEHPENVGHLAVAAKIAATRAEMITDNDAKRTELFNKALKACRRARERGDDSGSNLVFESQMLWNLGDIGSATSVLRTRLRDARELKSNELFLFLALLRIHVMNDDKAGFQQTAEQMVALMPKPDEPKARERCESVGGTVYEFAVELIDVRPLFAIECARLTAKFTPENPYPERLIKAAKERFTNERKREHAAKKAAAAEAERRRRHDENQYAGRSPRGRAPRRHLEKTRKTGLSWVAFLVIFQVIFVALGNIDRSRDHARRKRREDRQIENALQRRAREALDRQDRDINAEVERIRKMNSGAGAQWNGTGSQNTGSRDNGMPRPNLPNPGSRGTGSHGTGSSRGSPTGSGLPGGGPTGGFPN